VTFANTAYAFVLLGMLLKPSIARVFADFARWRAEGAGEGEPTSAPATQGG
jgi:hypothetical protein